MLLGMQEWLVGMRGSAAQTAASRCSLDSLGGQRQRQCVPGMLHSQHARARDCSQQSALTAALPARQAAPIGMNTTAMLRKIEMTCSSHKAVCQPQPTQ